MNKKRALAAVILLLFIAVLTLSLAYISIEADHRCTGGNCSICHNIAVCIGTLTVSTNALVFFSYVFSELCIYKRQFRFCLLIMNVHTLVSLKVKLSS